jgi:hypothetical protein
LPLVGAALYHRAGTRKGFLFGLLLIAGGVWAQNVSCALSGVIQDSGGAVFPALEIKLSSAGTEFVRTTSTNQEGFFSFPNLTPSTFTLSITATGFKSYRQSGIELSAGDQRSLGVIRLQLGEVTESVSVVAEANPVMLASGERSSVLTGEEIRRDRAAGAGLHGRSGAAAGGHRHQRQPRVAQSPLDRLTITSTTATVWAALRTVTTSPATR